MYTKIEPRFEKTCFRDLRQRKIQIGLLSYRDLKFRLQQVEELYCPGGE